MAKEAQKSNKTSKIQKDSIPFGSLGFDPKQGSEGTKPKVPPKTGETQASETDTGKK